MSQSTDTLPENILMHTVFMGHGAKGSATHHMRNEDYGVTVTAHRKSRRDPFISAWSADSMPGKEFPAWPLLRQAMLERQP